MFFVLGGSFSYYLEFLIMSQPEAPILVFEKRDPFSTLPFASLYSIPKPHRLIMYAFPITFIDHNIVCMFTMVDNVNT